MAWNNDGNRRTINDKYLLGEEIGKGAYGKVFKGVDLQNGDTVAIKQVDMGAKLEQMCVCVCVVKAERRYALQAGPGTCRALV